MASSTYMAPQLSEDIYRIIADHLSSAGYLVSLRNFSLSCKLFRNIAIPLLISIFTCDTNSVYHWPKFLFDYVTQVSCKIRRRDDTLRLGMALRSCRRLQRLDVTVKLLSEGVKNIVKACLDDLIVPLQHFMPLEVNLKLRATTVREAWSSSDWDPFLSKLAELQPPLIRVTLWELTVSPTIIWNIISTLSGCIASLRFLDCIFVTDTYMAASPLPTQIPAGSSLNSLVIDGNLAIGYGFSFPTFFSDAINRNPQLQHIDVAGGWFGHVQSDPTAAVRVSHIAITCGQAPDALNSIFDATSLRSLDVRRLAEGRSAASQREGYLKIIHLLSQEALPALNDLAISLHCRSSRAPHTGESSSIYLQVRKLCDSRCIHFRLAACEIWMSPSHYAMTAVHAQLQTISALVEELKLGAGPHPWQPKDEPLELVLMPKLRKLHLRLQVDGLGARSATSSGGKAIVALLEMLQGPSLREIIIEGLVCGEDVVESLQATLLNLQAFPSLACLKVSKKGIRVVTEQPQYLKQVESRFRQACARSGVEVVGLKLQRYERSSMSAAVQAEAEDGIMWMFDIEDM